jgi:hypothetical protein
MYVRKKVLKTGGVRYALVESRWRDGKSRQVHLYYLLHYPTPAACLAWLDEEAAVKDHPWFVGATRRATEEAARLRAILARGKAEAKARAARAKARAAKKAAGRAAGQGKAARKRKVA